jgi:hypothetical protein
MGRKGINPARNTSYPRDLVGYGRNPPDPQWPHGAVFALQFVINYDEGGENSRSPRRLFPRSSARLLGPGNGI